MEEMRGMNGTVEDSHARLLERQTLLSQAEAGLASM
jgi:hypothetical protein